MTDACHKHDQNKRYPPNHFSSLYFSTSKGTGELQREKKKSYSEHRHMSKKANSGDKSAGQGLGTAAQDGGGKGERRATWAHKEKE